MDRVSAKMHNVTNGKDWNWIWKINIFLKLEMFTCKADLTGFSFVGTDFYSIYYNDNVTDWGKEFNCEVLRKVFISFFCLKKNSIRWVLLSANSRGFGIKEEKFLPSLVMTDRITRKHLFNMLKDEILLGFFASQTSRANKALYNLYPPAPRTKCIFTRYLKSALTLLELLLLYLLLLFLDLVAVCVKRRSHKHHNTGLKKVRKGTVLDSNARTFMDRNRFENSFALVDFESRTVLLRLQQQDTLACDQPKWQHAGFNQQIKLASEWKYCHDAIK